MSGTLPLSSSARDVVRASPLAPYLEAFVLYLEERRYATSTVAGYLGSLAHVARWMEHQQLAAEQLDEAVLARFLDEHLLQCRCPGPVVRGHEALRAACGHLLALLRADGLIGESAPVMTPVEEELRCFEAHLEQVRGLAASTRVFGSASFAVCWWSDSRQAPSSSRRSLSSCASSWRSCNAPTQSHTVSRA